MASPNGLRSKVGRDLTCQLCKEHYKNPKLLSCLHTFCQECLESKVHESANRTYIVCPSCRTRVNLDGANNKQGVGGLQSNFLVKNMLDLLAVNLKEVIPCQNCKDQNRVTVRCAECAEFLCEPCADGHRRVRFTRNHSLMTLEECEAQGKIHSTAYCPKHEDGILKLFCETCQILMCRDCTIVGHPIATHNYRYVDEAYDICKDTLSTLSTEVDTQIPHIVEALGHLNDISQKLDLNKETVSREINQHVEQYVSTLRAREEELIAETERIYNLKRQVLHLQKEKLETDLSKLKIATEFTNKILIYGSSLEVLGIKKQLSNHLGELKAKKLKEVPLAPEHTEQIEFHLSDETAQRLLVIPQFGDVVSGPLSNPSAAIVGGEGLRRAITGKPTNFTIKQNLLYGLSVAEDDESFLKVKCKDIDRISEMDVAEEDNGIIRVTYVVNTPGQLDLAVFIKDQHVLGSPFTVFVYKEIVYKGKIASKLMLGETSEGPVKFACPYGIAISPDSGYIWVTDNGSDNDQIQVFGSDNKLRLSFGKGGYKKGQFNDPADVTFVGDDKVAVVDRGNHRIQIFTIDGEFLSEFGSRGIGAGQLCFPTGIAANGDGIIAVCDNGNKRVQLFGEDGAHLKTISDYSLEGIKFTSPWNAALNRKNQLIVTDSINHYVLVLDCANGKLLYKFGSHGDMNGQFNTPTGVAVDGQGNILVVDRDNNRVQVFSPTGAYISQIGNLGVDGAEFFHPGGICVSSFGSVVVADCLNKFVEIFQF